MEDELIAVGMHETGRDRRAARRFHQMRIAQVISLVMCLGTAALATAGDVRVTCSPGLNIFLDGEFVGVSIPKHDGGRQSG